MVTTARPECDRRVLRDARILHVQKAKGIGGSERHILSLCRGLRAWGARPRILWLEQAGFPLDALANLSHQNGLEDTRLPIRGHLDPACATRLRTLLRRDPPDLLHLHLIHATLHGSLAARMATLRPVVATRHGTEPYQQRPWFRLAARLADAVCDQVIVPSHWAAQYTARWDGTPAHKLRIIHHGIPLERFTTAARDPARRAARRDLGADEEDVVVGCVARLHAAKDHDTLLRAFALLHERLPQTHLVLVGGGPREAELRALAQQLMGARVERVHFLGERTDVGAVLAGWDIAALATHREGFCLAALEAMAAGLPLVVSRIGPLPELVEDQNQGFLVAPRNPAAMAGVLQTLSGDAALRARMGASGVARAQQFSEARMVEETAGLYADLLTQASSRAD